MNTKSVLSFMDKVTDAIQAAGPLANIMGTPFLEKVTGWASTAIQVGQNVLARTDDVHVVLTSNDVDDINARIATLDKINAQLNQQIIDS